MKNISIWSDIKQESISNTLNKNIEVDVLIIGGGITGISSAYFLKDSNLKVCLVEKNEIGSGVTSKSTAKLTYLQENIYSKIYKIHGFNKTKLYLNSQKEAIKLIRNIIKDNDIECNLEKVDSYVFTNKNKEKIYKEINLLDKLNIKLNKTNILPNKKQIKYAYSVNDTYVFHPIKYLYKLKNILNKNILIYENTKITSINKENDLYICKTDNNIIKTKKIIIASHYPYFFKSFFLMSKSYIEKSYIGAYKVNNNYKFSSINIDKPTISTRYFSDKNTTYNIFLTNSHNTSINDNDIKNFKCILDNKPEYIWSNMDIITSDYLPFIGSKNKDNSFLIGTGYNTWGMTNGTIAGKILSDIILKKENKYIELFNPKRKLNIGKILNFPLVIGSNTYSFIKSKINKNKHWYSNNIRFENINGKSIAIYTDKDNKEHKVYNLCPHLKCSLIFNEIEKTWDCPCHGSRFNIDGKSIEGPSNYDISYKN